MSIPNCKLPDPATLYQQMRDAEIPAYILKAGDYLAAGEARLCVDHLNRAADKTLASPWGWIVAATAHSQLGNHKTAIDVSTRGLQCTGENSHLLDCLGVAYAGLGDLAAARMHFQKAIAADSGNANAVINLANVDLSVNQIDAAFAVLDQGLNRNPGNMEIKQLHIQLHPVWMQSLEHAGIRIRIRMPEDDWFVKACYANQAFMNNYNRYLSGAFRRSRSTRGAHLKNRLNVYKNKCVQWVVERVNTDIPGETVYTTVGLASLADIQLVHRRAEVLIGFPDSGLNGSKFRVTAMLMILDFAFNTIGFNKLASIVYSDNTHAQKSTLALGFIQEGYCKNHLFDPNVGRWLSTYQNAMLLDDFKKNIKLAHYAERLLGGCHRMEERAVIWG